MIKIKGSIKNIIFRNEENGYTVLLLNDGKTVFTLIGNLTSVSIGENIEAEVEETYNQNYGKQYKIISYNLSMPNDSEAIEKYLASNEIKGIGKKIATRLVEYFGDDTINVIMNNPEKLNGIKGLTYDKIEILKNAINNKYDEIETILSLEKLGLGSKQIRNILDEYGNNALDIIKENPYKLALDVESIGFVICDRIAKLTNYTNDSNKRVEAYILYILEMEHRNGNVYCEKESIINDATRNLRLPLDYSFDDVFYSLEINLRIVTATICGILCVYLKRAYEVEKKLTGMLIDRKKDIDIITGGPGTGKTYNIKKLIRDAEELNLKIVLCAPTGRAAKRITEVTGHQAKTIHRLLECGSDGTKTIFIKNEDNKLELDILIVDEMSMVDENLLYHLIKALPSECKIVFVGDVDQLPSVGAGQVLYDMIESNLFNVTRLTEIHRQEEESNIVYNAHLVNSGKEVDLYSDVSDFKFIRRSDTKKINDSIATLVKENLPRYFNFTRDQIQVICPSKIGDCGTEALNLVLQNALNEEDITKTEIKVGDTVFRLNDKVMQTVNNYSIPYDVVDNDGTIYEKNFGIFNGDIGTIIEIDEDERSMIVKYDDKVAYYDNQFIKDLTLAYAITVHKSQGSEYEAVVIPLTNVPQKLQNRKILYTAITRAKKCICFVGSEKYFYAMENNTDNTYRKSALCNKIFQL